MLLGFWQGTDSTNKWKPKTPHPTSKGSPKSVLLTTPWSPFGLSNRKHTLSFSCKASAISPACSTAFRSRPGLKHAFVEQVSGERQTISTLLCIYTYSANYMLVTLNMNMLAYWENTSAGSNLRILPKICRQDQNIQTDAPKNWRCGFHTRWSPLNIWQIFRQQIQVKAPRKTK